MGKRIHWIDVTKGLLIFLMVLGHIANISGRKEIDNTFLNKCLFFPSLYNCFFMQAFIILTGFTSNFEKDIKTFFLSIFKTLFVPWLSFSIFCHLGGGGGLFVNINNQKFFFLIECYWFLQVLFFGKLIYYLMNRLIFSDFAKAVILLVMMACGFIIFASYGDMDNTYHYYNYLHYKDLLCMTFFLWFGDWCKRSRIMNKIKGNNLVILLLAYLIGHFVRFVSRELAFDELLIAPVVISHGCNVISLLQLPAFVFYVITGSLSCFGIMQLVNENRFLEYLGRNSLIIYCVHFTFLRTLVCVVNELIPPLSMIDAVIFIVITIISCLLLCSVVILLSRYRPFNYFIGKF